MSNIVVDNIALLRTKLNFEPECKQPGHAAHADDHFYFIHVTRRRKEQPGMSKNSRCVKTYYISSLAQFDSRMPEIKALCDHFGARAYLNLNRRSYQRVGLAVLEKVAKYVAIQEYAPMRRVYDSCAGATHTCDRLAHWVVDVDTHDAQVLAHVVDTVCSLLQTDAQKDAVFCVPTRNGTHVISPPFHVAKFEAECKRAGNGDVGIQKNNGTLLYAARVHGCTP